jgi:hypothetical protein
MRGTFARAFDRQATNMPIPPLTFPEVLRGGAVAEVDELLDAEPRGQRRGEDQAGVGDRVDIVEGHGQDDGTVRRWHRESALLTGTDGPLSNAILPAQRAFLRIGHHRQPAPRWIQA